MFDRIEVGSTKGDWRPPYAHQWVAYSKIYAGDDDPYEGEGGSAYEAIRNLYLSMPKDPNY